MSEARVVLRHSRIYAFAAILNRSAAFLMIPLYTRFLQQEEYGILGVIAITSEIVGAMVGLKLGAAMSRLYFDYTEDRERNEVVTSAILGASAFIALTILPLLFVSEPLAHAVLGRAGMGNLLVLGIAGLLLNTLYTFGVQYLVIRQRSGAFLLVGTLRSVVYILGTAFMVAWLKLGIRGALIGILVANAVAAIGLVGPLLWRLGLRFSRTKFVDMVRFGAPLVPGQLAEIAGAFAERYLIVHLASLAASGTYYLALRLGMVINSVIIGPFNSIYLVRRFEAYGARSEDPDAARVFTYFFAIVTLGGLALAMAAPEIVTIVAPSSYADAIVVVPLVCLTQVILSLLLIAELRVYYAKLPKYLTASNIAMLVAQVLLNIWLIPFFGIVGAAIAGVAAMMLRLAVVIFLSRGLPGPMPEWRTVTVILIAASLWFGVGQLVGTVPGWLGTAGKGVLLVSFPSALLASSLFTREEKRELFHYLRSLLHPGRRTRPGSNQPTASPPESAK